jgi:hypothetical protein
MFNVNKIALTAEGFMDESGYDKERAIEESLKKHGIENATEDEKEAVRKQLERHQEAVQEEEQAEQAREEEEREEEGKNNFTSPLQLPASQQRPGFRSAPRQ